jgi:hypothetical protein
LFQIEFYFIEGKWWKNPEKGSVCLIVGSTGAEKMRS